MWCLLVGKWCQLLTWLGDTCRADSQFTLSEVWLYQMTRYLFLSVFTCQGFCSGGNPTCQDEFGEGHPRTKSHRITISFLTKAAFDLNNLHPSDTVASEVSRLAVFSTLRSPICILRQRMGCFLPSLPLFSPNCPLASFIEIVLWSDIHIFIWDVF